MNTLQANKGSGNVVPALSEAKTGASLCNSIVVSVANRLELQSEATNQYYLVEWGVRGAKPPALSFSLD